MPPPNKRKRGDRSYSTDSTEYGTRPSPHRPQNLGLAQQNPNGHGPSMSGRGGGAAGRRSSRGGMRTASNQHPPSPSPSASAVSTTSHAQQRLQSQSGLKGPPSAVSSPTASMKSPHLTGQHPNMASRHPSTTSSMGPPPSEKPQAPLIIPRAYEYLTDDVVAAFSTSKGSLPDKVLKKEEDIYVSLNTMFQELMYSALEGRLSPRDAGAAVNMICKNAQIVELVDASDLFVDCIAILHESGLANATLHRLILSSGVSPALMRERLDQELLTALGLVRGTFGRMGIRYLTAALYKPNSYNLLREESEGYSKLITEYFTTVESQPPSGEIVAETFHRVLGLIGTFDLDVGRVLDVTLDVFANLLIRHNRFFVKFIRASTWWPETVPNERSEWDALPSWADPSSSSWTTSDADRQKISARREERDRIFWDSVREKGLKAYFEISTARELTEGEKAEVEAQAADEHLNPQLKQNVEWMKDTGTFPPKGNHTAAQLIGFKLRFYTSKARDKDDMLPDNLICLAALLIKIGFISLRDLYPHLYPEDQQMETLKEKLTTDKEERERKSRPGGGMNALTMAAPLIDDTLPQGSLPAKVREFAKAEEAAKKDVEMKDADGFKEPSNQKMALLKALLCIGALPEALYFLGRFPWLMELDPELPKYIHRFINHSISQIYEPLEPLAHRTHVREAKKVPFEQAGMPKGHLKAGNPPSRKSLRWQNLDRADNGDGIDYKFYWEDWGDNIPVCRSIDDFFALCASFMNVAGLKIGLDPALLTKMTRLGKWSLGQDTSEANFKRWADLLKRLIVPALSLTSNNPGVVNEVFELLQLYPTSVRYNIYAEWYTGATSRLPEMKTAFDQSRAETKDVLKRISKTNIKQMARSLAKISCASPGIVFSVAINQIEAYDNLIEVIVECARYFTLLGYDILTWTLLNSLGGKGRNAMQADGMLTSRWLHSLSTFTGRVLKRYSIMQPTPILQYVNFQLRNGVSTDLEILEQIVTSMSGIRSDPTFSEAQVQAMAGGQALQAQIMEQLLDKRSDARVSSKRLMKSLEFKLAGDILIALTHERQNYIFYETSENAPLKVAANNLDKIHYVWAQYLDLLHTNFSFKEFEAAIPGIIDLVSKYGIDTSLAFTIYRPILTQGMAEVDASRKAEEAKRTDTESPKTNGDVDMSDVGKDAPKLAESTAATPTSQESDSKDVRMEDASPESTEAKTPAPSVMLGEPWHPVLKPLLDEIPTDHLGSMKDSLSRSFYATFWQLAFHDMLVPTQSYEDEIKRLRERFTSVATDRSDISTTGIAKRDAKKKQITEVQDKLRAEMKSQITAYQQIRTRLQKEKDHWFDSYPIKKNEFHDVLLQECFFPRMLLSPLDAQYCVRMMLYLHNSGTPGFHTVTFIDRLLREKQVTNMIFQCTAREASNFGRFLNELLKELKKWHADQAVYEKAAFGPKRDLPGFARKLRVDKTPEMFLEWEDYRRLLYKWHGQIMAVFKNCFTSGEYMHIRNAISILESIHQHFPAINWVGKQILEHVSTLSRKDPRDDVKLAAMSLISKLKKREKEWLMPQAFRIGTDSHPSAKAPTAGSKAGTPAQLGKGLNASAAEFKPLPATTNGVATSPTKIEVEDGEIDDAKRAEGETTVQTQPKEVQPETAVTEPRPISAGNENQLPLPPKSATDERPSSHPNTPILPPQPLVGARPPSSLPPRPHGLPNKPEPVAARSRLSDRGDRPSERHADRQPHRQESRQSTEYGRLDRPGDISREGHDTRTRSRSPSRRRRALTPERIAYETRDRTDQTRPTSTREPRPADDRQTRAGRETRQSARGHPRDRPAQELQSSPAERVVRQAPGAPLAREEAPNRADTEVAPSVNPARAALIGQAIVRGEPIGRSSSRGAPRGDGQQRPGDRGPGPDEGRRRYDIPPTEPDDRSQRTSRAPSPRRARTEARDGRRDEYRGGHPDRPSHPSEPTPRGRKEENAGPMPTGPRGDRGARSDLFESTHTGRSRDLFNLPPRPPMEPSHGRLSDFGLPARPPQDPNYGRLNAAADTPQGPRGGPRQVGRPPRNFPAQGTGQPPHGTGVPSPSQERGPPSGPASGRRDRRDSNFPDTHQQRVSGPQASEQRPQQQETLGIHPSRLNNIQAAPGQIQPDGHGPPPSAPRSAHARSNQPSFPPASPHTQGPNVPSGPGRHAPTGPSGVSDRMHTMPPPQPERFPPRGRPGSRNLDTSQPLTQNVLPQQTPPRGIQPRMDQPPPSAPAPPPSEQPDLIDDRGRRRGGDERRSTRQSRRSSRERSRSPKDREERDRTVREPRERAGGIRGRDPPRDEARPLRSMPSGSMNGERDGRAERDYSRDHRGGEGRDRERERPMRDDGAGRERSGRDGRLSGRGGPDGPWGERDDGRNGGGEMRVKGSSERREKDERERREYNEMPPGSGGRDGRKRGRPEEGMGHMEAKRPRRSMG
ncbi:hypothetical protein P152DRAFT_311125 [Eremomyces bilateralis CBS 781.70]|uniref:THO complex subunit 2 n=1 Tax=Eremomyces bilateralis CBS 781.70 TaxID=1392243 RepID=A0A6G1G5F4_9PEZI|nr:uncharacterized protein P152DRAFT_311125 [Eremomyces bilateralis CBS 781.70]KAF1813248.1 hypothetical protein P152DRAFT_311125 [Eremomyces bilateralis CBS 781.70]